MTVITRQIAEKVLTIVDSGLVGGLGSPVPGKMCVEAAVCYALGESHGDSPSCVDEVLRDYKISLNDANWSTPSARSKGLRRLALAQLGSKGALDQVKFTKLLALMTVNKIIPIALRAVATIDVDHRVKLEGAATECEKAKNLSSAVCAAAHAAGAIRTAAIVHTTGAGSTHTAVAHAAGAIAAARAPNANANAVAVARTARAAVAAAAAVAAVAAGVGGVGGVGGVDIILSQVAEYAVQILVTMNAPGVQWLDLAPLESIP